MSSYYDSLAADPNNMSYWLPKLQQKHSFDTFKIPKTVIVKVPEEIVELFFMEKKGMTIDQMMTKIMAWVRDEFVPKAKAELGEGMWFIKNGGFSNKFDFSMCKNVSGNLLRLTANIIDINYTSFMFETGGNTELIAREYIPADEKVPTIYNGMPLRNEVRVFYDFDNHMSLYTANYWDWDYCHQQINRDPSDKIVYQEYYPKIEERYNTLKEEIIPVADFGLIDIQGLKGIWSVDFMEDSKGQIWLIDMAMAEVSAYWNPKLAEKIWRERGIEVK